MEKEVFISYSRKDTEIANQICEAFDNAGITYFIDRQGIGGGMEFPEVLAEAIMNCKIMLFVASRNSYASKFTNNEVTYAFNKKPKGTIIPYIIDDSTLPPSLEFIFSSINIRTIKEHPVNTILVKDICSLLKRQSNSLITEKDTNSFSGFIKNHLSKTSLFASILLVIGLSLYLTLHRSGASDMQTSPLVDTLGMYDSAHFMSSANAMVEEAFQTRSYVREFGRKSHIKIDFPIAGNESLLWNIRNAINKELSDENNIFKGDVNDINKLLDYYTGVLSAEYNEEGAYIEIDIEKVYENDRIVSYKKYISYYFPETPRVRYNISGMIFRKRDGRKFSIDMIIAELQMQKEIKNGLKEYFDVKSDADLMNQINESSLHNVNGTRIIPLPDNCPLITEKGFEFHYGEYEISYGNYHPSFTVSVNMMKQYLSDEGKTFIE